MTIDLDAARQRLEARRDDLEAHSERATNDRAAVALDQQSVGRLSRMDAMQQQAMAEAQERQRTAELQRIDVALRRVRDGDYGICDTCGEEIPEGRLAVDPSATLCVACASG